MRCRKRVDEGLQLIFTLALVYEQGEKRSSGERRVCTYADEKGVQWVGVKEDEKESRSENKVR